MNDREFEPITVPGVRNKELTLFVVFQLIASGIFLSWSLWGLITCRDITFIFLVFPCLLLSFFSACMFFFYSRNVLFNGTMIKIHFVTGKCAFISLRDIAWAKKLFPRMSLSGDYSTLWIIMKFNTSCVKRRFCIFMIRSTKLGLTLKECPTVLDEFLREIERTNTK